MDMQKEIIDLLEEHNQIGSRPAESDESTERWKFTDKILRLLFELNNRLNCQALEINNHTDQISCAFKLKPSPPKDRQDSSILVGDYMLEVHPGGRLWIRNRGGEGAEVTLKYVERMFKKTFKENF